MDSGRKKLRLGDLLINNKSITHQQLQSALEFQKGTGKKLGEVLVDEGHTLTRIQYGNSNISAQKYSKISAQITKHITAI